ncbi:hypothetical protein AcV5_005831 [Taiwanofungus camphoratus]|nr:hypothetical protein AcW2_004277 [Antrodia cinnamomea]KAI0933770.1 hypothetical protein AcV5_005831 [Antrodia cinnamomea]KAI0948432.1 hypothetical protein AcV7_009179 [Antrodia cinnamomea]
MEVHISTSSSLRLLSSASVVSQGAEAKVYKAPLHPLPSRSNEHGPGIIPSFPHDLQNGTGDVLLKYRFHKQYRHPSLDASLTKSRVAGEARALIKCLRYGVNVPGIRMVDAVEGVLGLELIHGKSVRFLLGGGAEGEEEAINDEGENDDLSDEAEEDPLQEYGVTQDAVMRMIGTEIAKMHQADVIHGDLTTSNMLVRHPSSSKGVQLVLIDFGLAYTSTLVEDKAVDLYVLERAFSSTHPASEPFFASVLNAYQAKMGREWVAISKRLDDVRQRGRKRSMVG